MCARLSLSVVFYRFGLKADRLPWPILIGICDQDLLWFNENGHQGGREDSTSTALKHLLLPTPPRWSVVHNVLH